METIPCPTCGLPRAVADAPITPCPVCGRLATDPATADDEPGEVPVLVPVEVAPRPDSDDPDGGRRNWLLVGGTVLAGAVIVGLLLWSQFRDRNSADPDRHASPVPTPAAVQPESAPSPRPASPAPVVAARPPEPAPLPRESILPPGPYAIFRLDRPSADYRLDRLGEGNRVKLVGRVKRLMIEGLDGGAALDASELTVQDVFFYGRLDGGATAVVRSAGGAVLFREPVTGQSRVVVLPGADFVSFAAVPTASKPGSQVAGGARVQLSAKAVHFAAPITDPDTTVEVTLEVGGTLRFAAVERAAKLLYRSAVPGPPPRVYFGVVRSGAESKYVQ
jgi:hypothetical protein